MLPRPGPGTGVEADGISQVKAGREAENATWSSVLVVAQNRTCSSMQLPLRGQSLMIAHPSCPASPLPPPLIPEHPFVVGLLLRKDGEPWSGRRIEAESNGVAHPSSHKARYICGVAGSVHRWREGEKREPRGHLYASDGMPWSVLPQARNLCHADIVVEAVQLDS